MKFTPLKRSLKPMKRRRLNPVSTSRALGQAEAREDRRRYLEQHNWCEAERAGAPGKCFGELHVHETLPRSRGGKITDVSLFKTCCDEHNRMLSQDVETMRWGLEHGYLEHSRGRIG